MSRSLPMFLVAAALATATTLTFSEEAAAQFNGHSFQTSDVRVDRAVANQGLEDVANNRRLNLKGLFDVNLNLNGIFQNAGAGGANSAVIGDGTAFSNGGNGNGNIFRPIPRPYPFPKPLPQPLPRFPGPGQHQPGYIHHNQIHQVGGPGSGQAAVIGDGTAFGQGGHGNGNQFMFPVYP